MSKSLKKIALSLLIPCVSNVHGQFVIQKELSLDKLATSWAAYQKDTKYNLTDFSCRYYTETVSVQEMKEAFYKNKDVKFSMSPYAGLDSIKRMGTVGESAMILSPLRNHPKKEVRECRGVWTRLPMARYRHINI